MRFYHHPPLHLMLGKQRIQQLSIAVGLRQADVILPLEIRRRQHLFCGQRMPFGQHAHFVQRQQLRAFRTGGRSERFRQAQIVTLCREPLFEQRRLLRYEGEIDLGIAGKKGL